LRQEHAFRRTKYLYLHNFAFAEIHNQGSNSKAGFSSVSWRKGRILHQKSLKTVPFNALRVYALQIVRLTYGL